MAVALIVVSKIRSVQMAVVYQYGCTPPANVKKWLFRTGNLSRSSDTTQRHLPKRRGMVGKCFRSSKLMNLKAVKSQSGLLAG